MAKATAASAAARTITKRLTTCPVNRGVGLNRLNATKLTFAAFRMSSTPIRMPMALRRVSTQYIPSEKMIRLRTRK